MGINTLEKFTTEQLIANKPRTRLLDPAQLELFDCQPAVTHLQTKDFLLSDPWSKFTRSEIRARALRGEFRGRQLREAGIGDGRNIRQAGGGLKIVEGIDVEKARLYAAAVNLTTGPDALKGIPITLWEGDAVDYLRREVKPSGKKIGDWFLMCLPQSPIDLSECSRLGEDTDRSRADYYEPTQALAPFQDRWNEFGFTLNAAVLANLREVADTNLRVLVVLSDRVPPAARHELIAETGWKTQKEVKTNKPVQQDPDTEIAWVKGIDTDKKRFYEKAKDDSFKSISATEAERRRVISELDGTGRASLNAYHHLYVVELTPNGKGVF